MSNTVPTNRDDESSRVGLSVRHQKSYGYGGYYRLAPLVNLRSFLQGTDKSFIVNDMWINMNQMTRIRCKKQTGSK